MQPTPTCSPTLAAVAPFPLHSGKSFIYTVVYLYDQHVTW